MSLFRVDENREIGVGEVTDIKYMPDIYLRRAAAQAEHPEEAVPLLTIVLKTGERLRIEGRHASEVWDDYKRAAAND